MVLLFAGSGTYGVARAQRVENHAIPYNSSLPPSYQSLDGVRFGRVSRLGVHHTQVNITSRPRNAGAVFGEVRKALCNLPFLD